MKPPRFQERQADIKSKLNLQDDLNQFECAEKIIWRAEKRRLYRMPNNIITGYYFDIIANENKAIVFENTIDELHRLCQCYPIHIITRKINGKEYAIVHDDEFLLRNPMPALSGIQRDGSEQLRGSIIITNWSSDGDLQSLTPDDIERIKKAIMSLLFHEPFLTARSVLIYG